LVIEIGLLGGLKMLDMSRYYNKVTLLWAFFKTAILTLYRFYLSSSSYKSRWLILNKNSFKSLVYLYFFVRFMRPHHRKQLGFLLITALIIIVIQVLLGAITRLTGSGLSITRWDIVTGTLPPLNTTAWNEAFLLYQQSQHHEPRRLQIYIFLGVAAPFVGAHRVYVFVGRIFFFCCHPPLRPSKYAAFCVAVVVVCRTRFIGLADGKKRLVRKSLCKSLSPDSAFAGCFVVVCFYAVVGGGIVAEQWR